MANFYTRSSRAVRENHARLHGLPTVRLLEDCKGTRDDKLVLAVDDLRVVKWYVDASFADHPNFKNN